MATPEEEKAKLEAEKAKQLEAEKAKAEAEKAKQLEAEQAKKLEEEERKKLEEEAFDKERAMATIKNLREIEKKAKALEKRNAELEANEQKRKDAELSETERLKVQLAREQTEHQKTVAEMTTQRIKMAFLAEATKTNFNDPNDASSMADISTVTVEDDGKVKGVEEAVKALVKAKPYLIKKAGAAGFGPTNPGAGGEQGGGETDAEKRKRLFG
jgi:hypothetical protein